MVLILLLVTACSQKQPEVTPKELSLKIKKDINTTTEVTHTRVEIKHESVATTPSGQVSTNAPLPTEVSQEEFVPEHIKRSHIEVVKHY